MSSGFRQEQSPGSPSDLAVTIVNLNYKALLKDCLQSIYATVGGLRIQVVVVDNASTDGSQEMVRQEFPQVRLMALDRVQGFAANQNLAIRAAGNSRYYLLLNNDTVVMPRALERMVAFMDEHPEVGVLGCKLLNGDGSLQRSCWRGYHSLRQAFVEAFFLHRLFPQVFEIRLSELDRTIEVDHVSGAAMMVRREAIEETGPLDESFPLFSEETDWCYRMKQKGWKICWIPGAEIIHYGEQTVSRDPQKYHPLGYVSYYCFYKKHSGCRLNLAVMRILLSAHALARVVYWGVRLALKRDGGSGRDNLRGYWLGFCWAATGARSPILAGGRMVSNR